MKLYNLFYLYNTALISFLASIFRDYLIINNTSQSLIFFKILYICSLASVLPINYISYSKDSPEKSSLFIICLVSILFLFYLCHDNFSEYLIFFFYGLLIFVLWIIGSLYSQILFVNGFIFISKSRESLASLITAFLIILFNFNLIILFLISILISLLVLIYLFNNKNLKINISVKSNKKIIHSEEVFKLVLSNISVVSMLFWALNFSSSTIVYGYPAEFVIRGSMYFFQALVIGSSVIIVSENKRVLNYWDSLIISAIILSFGFIISTLSLQLGVILMPFMCVVIHYINIHSINSR